MEGILLPYLAADPRLIDKEDVIRSVLPRYMLDFFRDPIFCSCVCCSRVEGTSRVWFVVLRADPFYLGCCYYFTNQSELLS